MNAGLLKLAIVTGISSIFALQSHPAWALRCDGRLVKEGMHELRVIQLCGEPISTRHVGQVLRPYIIKQPAGISVAHGTRHIYGGYHHILDVQEMLFNFGPHKLMRLMRFEGGQLTDIRTAGYGYRE